MTAINIIKKIKNSRDVIVNDVYNKICVLCENENNNELPRPKKLKYIQKNMSHISDEDLASIDKKITQTKNEYKREIVLELLNELLEHIGEDAIDSITEFRDIPKNLLLTDECRQIVLDFNDKIIEAEFTKNLKSLHRYKTVQYDHYVILKQLCKKSNHTLTTKQKNKTINHERVFTRKCYII